MATTATPKKETKADQAVAMKLANPSISNIEIGDTIGMAHAYVSQMLSAARADGRLPAKTTKAKATKATKVTVAKAKAKAKTTKKRTTSTPKVVITRAAKVSPAATATAGSGTMEEVTAILEARSQIACMVQRMGACAVKSIIADVTS